MGALVKTQAENGLSNMFNLWDHPIDVYDQSVFVLTDSGIHDEEGTKNNVSNPTIAGQKRAGIFVFHDYGPPIPG